MKVWLKEEDPSKIVIIKREERLLHKLDYLADTSKDIGDLFEEIALKSLNKGVCKFPVDEMKQIIDKISTIKNQKIQKRIPYKLLDLVSSSSVASEFFKDLKRKIESKIGSFDTKKRAFELFYESFRTKSTG